ncbi:LIV-E family branched chain amino acid permease AzlC [Paucilactobacillus suebicus DSM 5007 = KCTC 3549]|uniref:LIV-E family branched chain amino acid permease AzlC n=2 Tax=Paucilactobacillus suebicus TaxID=152335 RepID=A0A0R1W7I3_9LACO|nr:LIV-E family branched chain amino acid permease AzlC [Paucilactobacillus suebicus DSM 5007 = KCTC 3549]
MKQKEPNWLMVLKVSMPLCLSYIPIGLACGVLLHAAGFNFLMTLLVSIVVFSGGAQFLIASLLTINAPILSIVVTLFFLELRYALLGSSLSKYMKNQPQRFIWLFSVSLNDENYAINYLKFNTDKDWTPRQALMVEHYSLITWSVSNFIGSLIGSALTINLDIVDFALTALFLYMIVMQVRNRLTFLIGLLSAVLSIIFIAWTKSTIGIIISTLLASFVGFMVESYIRRHHQHVHHTWLFGKIRGPAITRKTVEDKDAEEADEADS